jgi:hypothetical protein
MLHVRFRFKNFKYEIICNNREEVELNSDYNTHDEGDYRGE